MACAASDTPCVIAGDDFYYDIQYTESDGETPIDLTGATAVMELRDSVTDATIVDTMSGGVSDGESGMMRFTLTATETSALLPRAEASRKLVFSVKITFSDATKYTVLTGVLDVEQAATE